MRRALALALLAAALGARRDASATPADVVFILLDTTRADRFGTWGNPRPTTPALDALGAAGVVFLRHHANAHATRPSMPQLMSGRYYHQNVLAPFRPDDHPREFRFSRPDPTAVLLPALLRADGYRTIGVSAHTWVAPGSALGAGFDALEVIPVEASRGHPDAAAVVDRAIALWHARERDRPLFLYLHLMDMHMPRFLPAGEPRFPVEGFDWQVRFKPGSEPRFGRERRRWALSDAHDFTALDRRHFEAVYDTRLAYADGELGRFLGAVRADDPDLRQTLVVVVADHGEELAEDGRTDHGDSLADTVQHIPWIVAGVGIPRGQRVERITENIDVLPTLLALLRLPLPPGTHVDGRPQLAPDGRACPGCTKGAAYYAWEDYRAIRTGAYLLRQEIDGSAAARCVGREQLYRVDGAHRMRIDGGRKATRVVPRLRRHLARRLDARQREFEAARYDRPTTPFLLRPQFWRLGPQAAVACVPIGVDTKRSDLAPAGWLWTGRGMAALDETGAAALPIIAPVPDGEYGVDAAVVPIPRRPWLFGFARWLRKAFLPETPGAYRPLGTLRSVGGRLAVSIPPAVGSRVHVVGLRLTPPDATAPASPGLDAEERARLKALGYLQ